MKSIFDSREIAACTSDIEQRVYTSRLLGRDKTLVLHGGGNTSVKASQKNAFGGLDMLVLNAGIFPGGCRIEALGTDEWRKVMQVNLDANFVLMREAHPFLKLAPRGGRVVIIGSKNVPAPGPGAAACRRARIAGLRLHDLRHTASTNLRQAGVDTMTALKIVSHKSEQMHRRYNTIQPGRSA